MTRALNIGVAFVAAAVNAALAQVLTAHRVPAALTVEAPYRAGDTRDSTASMWMLTLALFVWFLICSLVAALLATHFGWLDPANAIV